MNRFFEIEEQAEAPRVYNVNLDTLPAGTVYVGRPTKWGNPFVIGKHGTRTEVIALYADHLLLHPELVEAAKRELCGKNLSCHCAPAACHADILLMIANS